MAVRLLTSVPTAGLGVLVVGVALLLAIGGLLVVRRFVPVRELVGHNDVAGFIYAVLGVIYAVLVPFVLVIVWEDFRDAKNNVGREAQVLVALKQVALQLPAPLGQQLTADVDGYAREVIDDEWPRLARGEESPAVDAAIAALGERGRGVDPTDPRQAVLYDHLLAHLDELADLREERVFASREGLSPVMWVVLIAGGAVVIGYSYLYGVERLGPQVLMTAALTAVIAMILFVILVMDYPFTGDYRVGPDNLEQVVTSATAGR